MLYWLLRRRFRSSWPLLAIASFGILAAVTLMAVGAVYSRGLAEGGVRHTLAAADPAVLDAQIIVQNRPLGLADYQNLRRSIEDLAQSRLGFMTRDVHRFGRTQADWLLSSNTGGDPPSRGAPVGRPFFLTGFQEHTRLVDGRWPQSIPPTDRPPGDSGSLKLELLESGPLELEVVVGRRASTTMGWPLGSRLSLFPFRGDASERVNLTVVGLAEPIEPQEEYWLNAPVYFSTQTVGEQLLIPLYLPEKNFFDGLGTEYPAAVGDFGWFLFLDTNLVTASTASPTRDAVAALETDINKRFPRTLVISGLDNTLASYERELTLARVPLYLFIGLVVLLILYFLALVMGMLARHRAEEAALLRSRGGSIWQVGGLMVAAEAVVALLSMVVGPFLALAIVRFLLLKTIDPLGVGDGGVSVGISGDMFVMGAIGGLLSLGVLALNGWNRARVGMIGSMQERARPNSVPFLHRYYVDVLVLAALGLLWWQIDSRGGFISRDVASRALEVNPSLLFGPVLVLLAAAFVVLRILPWVVRMVAWGLQRVSPAWASFSLVRLARDPLPHGALVIVLMMAAALGVFGASFQPTLAKSQEEQALYRHGGELVIRSHRFTLLDQETVVATPGVRAVSAITRDSVLLIDGLPGRPATLLGLNPNTLDQTAWFREDFAGQSLRDLLGPLRGQLKSGLPAAQDPSLGVPIPVDSAKLGAWVNVANLDRGGAQISLNLWARVRDGRGRYTNVLLGDLFDPLVNPQDDADRAGLSAESAPADRERTGDQSSAAGTAPGWVYLENQLPGAASAERAPHTLVSLFLTKTFISAVPPGSIHLDDITVIKSGGAASDGASTTIIEGFEDPGLWLPMANRAAEPDTLEYTSSAARTGRAGITFSWRAPLVESFRGIIVPPGPYPLPAVTSAVFRPGQVIRFRDGKQVIPVAVQNVTNFFPTLNPSDRPFVLVSRQAYSQLLRRLPQSTVDLPQELWVSLDKGLGDQSLDREQVILSLRDRVRGFVTIQERDRLVEVAGRNPLAGGGWNGLTILALSAITVAVVLTLAIHGIVAVHTGRVDLTVARAIGFSNVQLFLSLALERALVAALGIGAGAGIGLWLGRWVLGFLDITSGGQPVIPPMNINLQGWLVALVLASLVGATVFSLLLTALWVRRLKAPEVLRNG